MTTTGTRSRAAAKGDPIPDTDLESMKCEGCGVLPGQKHTDTCPVYLDSLRTSPGPGVPIVSQPEPRAANVIEALLRVMRDLPGIGKDSHADPAQGGYAYRGIEAITMHAQVLFAKHGVVFAPRVVDRDSREIEVGRDRKIWHDEIVHVEYDVYGPGGINDKITVGPIVGIGRDGSDKGTNKCMTQAFKYALLQVLCISDKADDTDGLTVEAEAPAPPVDPETAAMTPDQASTIRALVRTLRGLDVTEVEGKPLSVTIEDGTTVVLSIPILTRDEESNAVRPAITMAAADDLVDRLDALVRIAQEGEPEQPELPAEPPAAG